MYTQPTSRISSSVTSSPALAGGHWHFAAPAGQMTDLFGLVPAPANLSARQAKDLGLLTSGTSGQHSITSSASAALQAFLESRLRARTQILGSTLYKLTWKPWATPSGPSRFRLRASALRTSEIAITGWPTPTAALAAKGVRTFEGGLLEAMRTSGPDLAAASCLAGWPTPLALDHNASSGTMINPRDVPRTAALAGWPTTTATDALRQPSIDFTTPHITLNHASVLSGWPTPMAKDGGTGGSLSEAMASATGARRPSGASIGKVLKDFALLATPARLTASGRMLTGYSAAMPSGGQLRPGHSRWLMGHPPAWCSCAPGHSDWQSWQALMAQASAAPSPTESERCEGTATPSTPSRPQSSSAL